MKFHFYMWITAIALLRPAYGGDEQALRTLIDQKENILHAGRVLRLSPRLLASVVYAEHVLNVKPGEQVLDVVFARTGYSSSLGIAQVKVNTAEWLERVVNNRSSLLYLGETVEWILPISHTRSELIDKLTVPSTNLLYAAAYLRIIDKLWGETLTVPWLQDSKAGILGTLYSLGINLPNGSLRQPHTHPRMNHFGEIVQEFNDSFLMVNELPR